MQHCRVAGKRHCRQFGNVGAGWRRGWAGLPVAPRIQPAICVAVLPAKRRASLPAVREVCGLEPTGGPCRIAGVLAKCIAGNWAMLAPIGDGGGSTGDSPYSADHLGCRVASKAACQLAGSARSLLAELTGTSEADCRVAGNPRCRQFGNVGAGWRWGWAGLPVAPRIRPAICVAVLPARRFASLPAVCGVCCWNEKMSEPHCRVAGKMHCRQYGNVGVGWRRGWAGLPAAPRIPPTIRVAVLPAGGLPACRQCAKFAGGTNRRSEADCRVAGKTRCRQFGNVGAGWRWGWAGLPAAPRIPPAIRVAVLPAKRLASLRAVCGVCWAEPTGGPGGLPSCWQNELPAIWQCRRRLEMGVGGSTGGSRYSADHSGCRVASKAGCQLAGGVQSLWAGTNRRSEPHCRVAGKARCRQFGKVGACLRWKGGGQVYRRLP